MVDPLDGTKEFLKRNGEFTVNIALIQVRPWAAGWRAGVVYMQLEVQAAGPPEGHLGPMRAAGTRIAAGCTT